MKNVIQRGASRAWHGTGSGWNRNAPPKTSRARDREIHHMSFCPLWPGFFCVPLYAERSKIPSKSKASVIYRSNVTGNNFSALQPRNSSNQDADDTTILGCVFFPVLGSFASTVPKFETLPTRTRI